MAEKICLGLVMLVERYWRWVPLLPRIQYLLLFSLINLSHMFSRDQYFKVPDVWWKIRASSFFTES
jgi:hypothetical protein